MTINDRFFGYSGDAAVKLPVVTVTTGPITLFDVQTVNSVVLNDQDRILVNNQADATTNGIYIVQAGLRDALRVQDADFDRFRREVIEPLRTQVGELRHGIKGVQSYPKTLVTVVSRVQQLERENIARNSKAQGFRLAAHAIWGVLTGIGTFLGLLLGSHHQ